MGPSVSIQGRQLHEDEYAYDIILRLARELLSRGAKVHIIIQDKKDGIRDGHVWQTVNVKLAWEILFP